MTLLGLSAKPEAKTRPFAIFSGEGLRASCNPVKTHVKHLGDYLLVVHLAI